MNVSNEINTYSSPTWAEVLQYDESVPSCLRWTVSRARQKAGEPAAEAFELCEFVRKEVLDTLNQRGAEYTYRHGKPKKLVTEVQK